MLSSLLRPQKSRRRIDRSPFASPFASPAINNTGDTEGEQDRPNHGDGEYDDGQGYNEGEGDEDQEPLLPIFSAELLDKIPLYNITHAIRMLIIQKCETTLTSEQMRSPQVSQFLVKPIQSQIRNNHFNRATLTALLANCLQFKKEAETSPGNASVSRTRAMLAELLAMRLLKEYTTRELIDALSYDFDPLQGMTPIGTGANTPGGLQGSKSHQQTRSARISTVEIAIRATAKKFLAHPLVVQQLEAIWAGSIVFHSAADHLHRKPEQKKVFRRQLGYGTLDDISPMGQPTDYINSKRIPSRYDDYTLGRRSVSLYNPRDASLFKLSRLRVPRYRQLFSTLSYAFMLGLFLAVLVDRSVQITPLEIVFWVWSAGYMLDEVVGFSEQGFGLYIMSVWNAFDLGILLLFIVYYILRLWGLIVPDEEKHRISHMAYDVLASTSILLFPRAFSVLDHYRYFSQLLIAFRMMAQDLVAILILILIACSGFFVAFTLAFSSEDTYGTNVAYALFQIVLGFTPAAWNVWGDYNLLGQIIMAFFLIICHFLIVTILITVLTNSFMAIVQNANEEHQFLFAVNTISMVKSDALFSYIAPTNVLAWIISPLRYIISFRRFVKFNRTTIKFTHFPVLFIIFAYERLVLSRIAYEPTDLVERNPAQSGKPITFTLNRQPFSPGPGRMREASVVSYHKDRALDEVFRRPFRGSTKRTTAPEMEQDRRQSANVVDNWMNGVGQEGGASPPMEQPQSVLDRLETRRPTFRRAVTADKMRGVQRDYSASRSVISDPEDRNLSLAGRRPKMIEEESEQDISLDDVPQDTEADGDDELVTGEEDNVTVRSSRILDATPEGLDKENDPTTASDSGDYFATPVASKMPNVNGPASISHAARARLLDSPDLPISPNTVNRQSTMVHSRNASTRTVVFQPPSESAKSSASEYPGMRKSSNSRPQTARQSGANSPVAIPPFRHGPRPITRGTRPGMPSRAAQQTAPALRTLPDFQFDRQRVHRQPSFNAMALDLASNFDENHYGSAVDVGGISGMPASFSEQLFRERELERRAELERKRSQDEQKDMVGRIMLARMNTLEEGFREMLKEVRVLRKDGNGGSRSGTDAGSVLPSRSQRGSGLTVMTNAPTPNSGSNSAPSSGLQMQEGPRTPLLRTTSVRERSKKSPRKLQRRGKGKEAAAPGSSGLVPVDGQSPNVEDVTPLETPMEDERELMGAQDKRASVIFVGDGGVDIQAGEKKEQRRGSG